MTKCACSKAPKLIFPCSGASDVGELSDRTGRRLTKLGLGKMYCLAGIGGEVNDILVNTRAADKILAIDGCKLDCAKMTLEKAGFTAFDHIRLENEGFKKGESQANGENIEKCINLAKEFLNV